MDENKNEILNWLIDKTPELGTGIHTEYYVHNEDYANDIKVKFQVTLK